MSWFFCVLELHRSSSSLEKPSIADSIADLFSWTCALALGFILWPSTAFALNASVDDSGGDVSPLAGIVDLGIAGDNNPLGILLDILTGPTATALGMVAMAGVCYGIILKAQRGESIRSLATVAIALLILQSIGDFISFLGFAEAAGM